MTDEVETINSIQYFIQFKFYVRGILINIALVIQLGTVSAKLEGKFVHHTKGKHHAISQEGFYEKVRLLLLRTKIGPQLL